eukprot:s883_g11.t1
MPWIQVDDSDVGPMHSFDETGASEASPQQASPRLLKVPTFSTANYPLPSQSRGREMDGSLQSSSNSLNAGAGHLWNRSQTPAVYQGSLASSSMPSPVTLQAAPSIPTLVQPGPMLPPPSLMQTSTFLPPWIEQGSPRSTIEAPHAFVFHARPPRSASPSPQRQATWAAPMRVQPLPVANPCEATSGSPRQALMQPVRIVHPRSVPAPTMSPSQASSIGPRKQAVKEMSNILKVLVLRKMAAGFARLLQHTKEQELMDKGAVELLTQLNSYDELAHQRPGRVRDHSLTVGVALFFTYAGCDEQWQSGSVT